MMMRMWNPKGLSELLMIMALSPKGSIIQKAKEMGGALHSSDSRV